MSIEYMTGVGMMGATYAACGTREPEFVDRAAKWERISPDAVRQQLEAGVYVQFDRGDAGPYFLRDTEIAAKARQTADAAFNARQRGKLRCKKCGQTGNRGDYPFSTLPSSGRCDDCV